MAGPSLLMDDDVFVGSAPDVSHLFPMGMANVLAVFVEGEDHGGGAVSVSGMAAFTVQADGDPHHTVILALFVFGEFVPDEVCDADRTSDQADDFDANGSRCRRHSIRSECTSVGDESRGLSLNSERMTLYDRSTRKKP